jgi:Raf kinase inhibitor-like YbhB/YbcL family protein
MMRLTSPSFRERDEIPKSHAAEGDELSPPLSWSELPRATRSLALVMEDADAPSPAGLGHPFLHWLVYNLQPSSGGIELGANRTGLPAAAHAGRNDLGQVGYSGPDPPGGRHRYVFRLLALDTTLNGHPGHALERAELLESMRGHVLDTAELVGTYERELLPERLAAEQERRRG